MGGGTWTTSAFSTYSKSVGRSIDVSGVVTDTLSSQEMYKQSNIHEKLNPYNVMRECKDTAEHPKTIPVILALDVTGSMGEAAVEVAKNINRVMTDLYSTITDIEFMVMGIGDLACDRAPIQISQFESDIRIAEQLDQVYFEYGGGGNSYESYTAAWYMGLHHTNLDCWSRGVKGIIITLGDEFINPYLPHDALNNLTGDSLTEDIETNKLYEEASRKFDIYHIDVAHRYYTNNGLIPSWKNYLDDDHFKSVSLNAVADTIVKMISHSIENQPSVTNASDDTNFKIDNNGEVAW